MKRFSIILSAAILVLSSPLHAQDVGGIYPPSLEGRESYEVGDLIYQLIPDDSQAAVPWGHMANSGIRWLTTGVERADNGAGVRGGVVRVNVMGDAITALRNTVDELGWTVAYYSKSYSKWGADIVTLQPGTHNVSCLGYGSSGCSFEIEDSLRNTPLEVETICDNNWRIKVYRVTQDGKRPSSVMLMSDGGSSGARSEIMIMADDPRNDYDAMCEPPNLR